MMYSTYCSPGPQTNIEIRPKGDITNLEHRDSTDPLSGRVACESPVQSLPPFLSPGTSHPAVSGTFRAPCLARTYEDTTGNYHRSLTSNTIATIFSSC